jgi:hypothetical protein
MTRRFRWWVLFVGVFVLVAARIGLVRFWIFGAVAIAFVLYFTQNAYAPLLGTGAYRE